MSHRRASTTNQKTLLLFNHDWDAIVKALADPIHWFDPVPAYTKTVDYTFEWLAGYQALPQAHESG